MSAEVKRILHRMYELCDVIDATPAGIKSLTDDFSLRDALFTDTARFIMYLSASDGTVSKVEAEYLSDLFDGSMTPAKIGQLIEKQNIYSTEFEQEAPLSLKIFAKADNMMGTSASETLLGFFSTVGKEFCMCDGDVAANERVDLNIYIGTMRSYIDENLKCSDSEPVPSKNTLKEHYKILKKSN